MGRQRQMVHLLPTQPIHSHAQAARLLFFLLIPSNSLGFLCAAANSSDNDNDNDKLASTTHARISEISNLENVNNWRLLVDQSNLSEVLYYVFLKSPALIQFIILL